MSRKSKQIRVPTFLTGQDKEEKVRLMKQYSQWRNWEVAELMKEDLKKKLSKLILIDEEETLVSKFLSKFNRARRLGNREAIRAILKDLN